MTREEAIKVFSQLLEAFDQCEHGDYFYDFGDMVCEAAEVAIAALREQDSNANQHVSNTPNALGGWISVADGLPEDLPEEEV